MIFGNIFVDVGGASSGGAYKPPSMRAGASQSASAAGGKKMDFGGKGPLNKGTSDFTIL